MKITLISDTHTKHKQCQLDLPGGDILIHAGDISSMGYKHEIREFCAWYNKLTTYDHKVFIAGNHDWGFQDNVEKTKEILDFYKDVHYLQDDLMCIGRNEDAFDYDKMIKIWGSPWQPEFHNWAFNLPRQGEQLKHKWSLIPENTDILVTHGPAWGILDTTEWNRGLHLGCELLTERISQVKPKIHVCGHIHSGHGYYFDGTTHFFNASILGERYTYQHRPITFDWDKETNEIKFT